MLSTLLRKLTNFKFDATVKLLHAMSTIRDLKNNPKHFAKKYDSSGRRF